MSCKICGRAAIAIFLLVFAFPSPTTACGWWGDGEASDSDDAIEVDSSGRPIVTKSHPKLNAHLSSSMKIPGAIGYGLVVTNANKAVPILDATGGLGANDIGKLSTLGYVAVIDLATPARIAELHRRETEELGMRYFNIPGGSEESAGKEVAKFAAILKDSANLPLLVFGHSPQVLASIWVDFRISLGIDEVIAHQEGRSLSMPEGVKKSTPPAN